MISQEAPLKQLGELCGTMVSIQEKIDQFI